MTPAPLPRLRRTRRLLAALALLLAAGAAPAANEAADMNAISKTWTRYAELGSDNQAEAADLLAQSSLDHLAFVRDAAIYASPDQVRRLLMLDRLLVYLLRASHDDQALAAMDGRQVARLCMSRAWCGVAKPDQGEPLASISHVTVLGEIAVAEYKPHTETQYQFGPEFTRQAQGWRVRFESLLPDLSKYMQNQARQAALSDEQWLQGTLSAMLGADRQAPMLAVLDQPLKDDDAARQRLNEHWPEFREVYANRLRAVEKKAGSGDTFAQYILGATLYSGGVADIVTADKPRGLELLEQASDGGQRRASLLALQAMLEQYRPAKGSIAADDVQARLARHARSAAEGGYAQGMQMYSGLLFQGAGGLARDCRQAGEWAARAEDSGGPQARNERVWYAATCAITEQRDPARALALAAPMIARADKLPAGELDTVAAAYAANGQFPAAIAFQQRAIAALHDALPTTRKRMQLRLAGYQHGQAWVDSENSFARPAE